MMGARYMCGGLLLKHPLLPTTATCLAPVLPAYLRLHLPVPLLAAPSRISFLFYLPIWPPLLVGSRFPLPGCHCLCYSKADYQKEGRKKRKKRGAFGILQRICTGF